MRLDGPTVWHEARRLAILLAVVSFIMFSVGCASAKAQIGKAADVVQHEAAATKTDLQFAIDTGGVGKEAAPPVKSAMVRQDRITAAAAGIVDHLDGVKDVTPSWVRWFWSLAGLAAVAGAVYVLAATGMLPLVFELVHAAARFVGGWLVVVLHPKALHNAADALKAKRQALP